MRHQATFHLRSAARLFGDSQLRTVMNVTEVHDRQHDHLMLPMPTDVEGDTIVNVVWNSTSRPRAKLSGTPSFNLRHVQCDQRYSDAGVKKDGYNMNIAGICLPFLQLSLTGQ